MTGEDVPAPRSELLLYQTEDGRTRVECRFDGESLWLTQALMAELFQSTPQNITQHLGEIYADGELVEGATCKQLLQVRVEGGREVKRSLRYYRLEAILAVGYRVRSHRGIQFRQWATARLSEYLVVPEARGGEAARRGSRVRSCNEGLEEAPRSRPPAKRTRSPR